MLESVVNSAFGGSVKLLTIINHFSFSAFLKIFKGRNFCLKTVLINHTTIDFIRKGGLQSSNVVLHCFNVVLHCFNAGLQSSNVVLQCSYVILQRFNVGPQGSYVGLQSSYADLQSSYADLQSSSADLQSFNVVLHKPVAVLHSLSAEPEIGKMVSARNKKIKISFNTIHL